MSMALHGAADHRAVEDVHRGEQRRRPVPHMVVRHRSGAALLQWQSGVGFDQAPVSGSHGDLRVKNFRSGSHSTLRSSLRIQGLSPFCMTRLVADAASNSHPVAALLSAAPISRLRRARAQESGTILFFGFWSQAKSRSARLNPPELIGLRKIGGALVLRRPLSRLLPVRSRRSHISRRRSAAFGPRQRSVPSGFGRH
jgi:hypothetical protein